MAEFTPVSALAGGALIGAGAATLLVANGRIAGITGIVGGLLEPVAGEVSWRVAFLGGMAVGALALLAAYPAAFGPSPASPAGIAVAGLLVGAGTRYGSGCTSGHGVCGISRFSPRSIVATCTFIGTGILTVALLRVVGVSP